MAIFSKLAEDIEEVDVIIAGGMGIMNPNIAEIDMQHCHVSV